MADVTPKSPRYNGIPKQVSRKDFNRYIWFRISRNVSKAQSRNSLSTRSSTISSMFCIRVFNGINSEPGGMNCIGLMSTNEPVASGVYFYTFSAGDFTATRKMLIMK